MFTKIVTISLTALALTACGATTQGALAGGAMGAAAGAIIGNNTGSGDARTGAIGAAGGAYAGCRSEGTCVWDQNNAHQSRLYTDQRTGGQYYFDDRDGCSYWRNGQLRGC